MRTISMALLWSTSAGAATWTVDADGQGDFLRIQDAVTQAQPGDRIEVMDGTYEEAINPEGKDLHFLAVGEVTLRPPTSPDAPVFLLDSGESLDTVIEGFLFEAVSGIGIWTQDSNATLVDLRFVGLGDIYGGALVQEGGELHIDQCSFSGGSATHGGQIYSTGGILKVEGSQFVGASAQESGGSIYLSEGDLQLSGSQFEHNSSSHIGGAIALIGSSAWLDENEFSENSAYFGGAVGGENSAIGALNNVFDENTAYDGGGIALTACYDPPEAEEEEDIDDCEGLEGLISFDDSDSYFFDNVALDDGGAIHLNGDSFPDETTIQASFTRTEFQGNFGDDKGGAVFAYDFVGVLVDDATFSQNVSDGNGGALYLQNSETENLFQNSHFDRNVSYYSSGGAIYATNDNHVIVDNCDFIDNRADDAGGAIVHYADFNIEVTNSYFESNETETRSGGAIYFENSSDFDYDLTVKNCTFLENQSGLHGGAVYANDARDIYILHNHFESNRASTNSAGGALMFWDQTAVRVHDNIFIDNGAHYGGASYSENTWPRVDGEPSNLKVDEWTNNAFYNNRAILGGGLAFLSNPLTDFRNNTLIGNVGTTDASGLHLYTSFGKFRNNLFAYSPDGQAIVSADVVTSEQAVFWNNAFWQNVDGNFGNIEVDEIDGNFEIYPMLSGSTEENAPEDDTVVLVAGSPLIDAGDSQLQDPDGSDSDIWARGGPEFPEDDADQDGVSNQYDCNDQDADIYPGADEIWYDGINQDCGLGSDYDQDLDGAKTSAYGGPDCDDKDPSKLDDCEVVEDNPDSDEEGCGCSSGPTRNPLPVLGLLGLILLRRREDQGS